MVKTPQIPSPKDMPIQWLSVGPGAAARKIALRGREGREPGLFWLGGFQSDMEGSKALAVDAFAAQEGLAMTRFDYSGHGISEGSMAEGTISRWLEEAAAVLASTKGEQILIGSSMGGWLALLLAEKLRQEKSDKIVGLVLIAPAVDMTEALIWPRLGKAGQRRLIEEGALSEASEYAKDGMLITRALIEDGRQYCFGQNPIEPGCPVHILQGEKDVSVPSSHALMLLTRLAGEDVILTLIKDGDHRLSRPEDIERLTAAIAGMIEHCGGGDQPRQLPSRQSAARPSR